MADILAAALDYAARGWHVFPCIAGGKTPLTPNGFKDATTDPGQIREFIDAFGQCNIGIATGASGLVVLDVDTKNGGIASIKALLQELPEIRNGLLARTSTDGLHYYFAAREGVELRNSAGRLGAGLDIRANGGYVIAPPSTGANGNLYRWERDGTPVLLPARLLARMQVAKWSAKPLTGEPVIEGGRNDYLTKQAGKLRRISCEFDTIVAALAAINQGHCKPPLDEYEVRQIAQSVCRYQPEAEFSDISKGKRRLHIVSYDDIADERLEWLWGGRIPYGKLTLLVGLPGKTKSYLTCAIAGHVTKGELLPDDRFNLRAEPASVLLLTYEDGQGDTIKARLRKCGADMSRVYTVPMEHDSFNIREVEALEEAVREHPDIRLIIIDPVQNMMVGVNDYSDTEVRQAMNPLIKFAMRHKIAVLGIKHLNKDESKSVEARVGGSQAYTGLARTILFAGHDNEKPFGPNHEVYAAVMQTKGNVAGMTSPICYEVNDRGLTFLGSDPNITADRLLPKPPDRKKASA